MTQYTTEELKQLYTKYSLENLNDSWNDEMYATEQEMSDEFVIPFLNWLELEDKHYLLKNIKPE